MAFNDNAVFTAAGGYVLLAPVGTAAPTPAEIGALTLTELNLSTPSTDGPLDGWTPIGHTSREEMPEFGFDGGETEVRGTWQNAALREVETEQIADYLTLFLHQFDEQSLELYYGPNASSTAGVFGVAGGQSTPTEKAMLIVIVDGDFRLGFYAPKASIRRDDAISLPNDEFAALPVRATFLKHNAMNLYEWINEDLFV